MMLPESEKWLYAKSVDRVGKQLLRVVGVFDQPPNLTKQTNEQC